MGERLSLDELFARHTAQRLIELEQEDAFNKTPEGIARQKAYADRREAERQARVRLGLETEEGDPIPQPEDDDEDADERDDEED